MDAIRAEETLTLAERQLTLVEVDTWEQARFKEDEARNKTIEAKNEYENAIRRRLFSF